MKRRLTLFWFWTVLLGLAGLGFAAGASGRATLD